MLRTCALLSVTTLIGCSVSVGAPNPIPKITVGTPENPDRGYAPSYSDNNRTHALSSGTYWGDLSVTGNRITVDGSVGMHTYIDGNLVISGNSNVVRNLNVRGSVEIAGNDNRLENVVHQGALKDNGKNNRVE
jgi:hypothetical protein